MWAFPFQIEDVLHNIYLHYSISHVLISFVADPCNHSPCEFCVVHKSGEAKCVCPEGKVLNKHDGKTCDRKLTETETFHD